MAQASPVYDPDADERPVRNTSVPPSDEGLRHITGISPDEERAMEKRAAGSNSVYDTGGHEPSSALGGALSDIREGEESPNGDRLDTDGPDDKSQNGENLRRSEESPSPEAGESLYNPYDSTKRRLGNFRGRASRLGKSKLLLGGAAIGGGGLFLVFILLLILASSLKIPNLAQHIAEYQFARVLRQATDTNNRITYQRLALDSLDDKAYSNIRDRYQGVRNDTWGKLDKYRPAQVMKNLKTDRGGGLKYNYRTTVTGRQQLVGLTLGNQSYRVVSQSGFTKYIPGFSGAVQFKNNVQFSKQFAPAVTESLRANDIGPIVRGRVASNIRKELGIGLIAWNVGKYKGKTEAQSRLQETRDAHEKVSSKGTIQAKSKNISDAVDEADKTLQEDLKDDKATQEIIDNGGSDPKVEDVVEKNLNPGAFEKISATVNQSYAGALAVCMIYEGSLTESAPTINSQTAAQQRSFYYLASGADQQKSGEITGEAIGAVNAHVGDISQSNPEVRAAGGKVDTSTSLSAEASPAGDYTIVDAILGTGFIGGALETGFDKACPTLTDPVKGTAIGLALAALTLVPGAGQAEAAGATAANTAAKGITTRLVDKIAEKFANRELSKQAAKEAAGRAYAKAKFIGKDTVKSGVKITGITILAKLIVMSKSNQLTNGLEQDQEFVNNADAGAGIHANLIENRQFYGRPMTREEAGASRAADLAYVADQNANKPMFDRYLATSNPDSFLNHAAMMTASTVSRSRFSSVLSLGNGALNPLSSLQHLFSSIIAPKTFAAATYNASTDDYGNITFGYSDEEMRLLRTDYSYSLLDNQQQLDSSGNEDAIQEKYGKCFEGKLGDMIAQGWVVRDQNGNVKPDEGDCAPNKLGPNNNEFGPQMVFRWRVANNYGNGLDDLNNRQEITADIVSAGGSSTTDTPGIGGTAPSGSAKELASQLVPFVNQQKIKCLSSGCPDIKRTAEGQSIKGGEGCLVDSLQPALLGMLLKLAESGHTFILSALCSDHHNDGMNEHSGGNAADFNTIDGVFMGPSATAQWDSKKVAAGKKLDEDVTSFMPKSTEFGQVQCHASFDFLKGFKTYNDGCHHQHIRAGS